MEILLGFIFFIIAVLYGSVGMGGASGYLAVMGLFGLPPEIIKPTALTLGILVSAIGTFKYVRAGHFSARIFWPIAFASIPAAFIGGRLTLPSSVYLGVVALVIFYAAFRLWRSGRTGANMEVKPRELPIWLALITGALLGFASGLIGIGGGIFLGPVLLLTGWVDTKKALGITAAYVLTNSIAGLAGRLSAVPELPDSIWWWLLAVGIGGWLGAEFGSQRLDPRILRRMLAVILLAGALRMVVTVVSSYVG